VAADLLVFTSPVYVFHVTAQLKTLLDHYASKWMAHSPEKPLFKKQAVIITNGTGQGMGKTARDIQDSLDYWGIARTYVIKQAMFQAKWENVDGKRKESVRAQCERVAAKVMANKHVQPRLKIKALFFIMKMAQIMIDKAEHKAGRERTKDYRHWKVNGWLGGKKPWVD
jgi:multimeric flavodoxin WrbA